LSEFNATHARLMNPHGGKIVKRERRDSSAGRRMTNAGEEKVDEALPFLSFGVRGGDGGRRYPETKLAGLSFRAEPRRPQHATGCADYRSFSRPAGRLHLSAAQCKRRSQS
jgi:hypothetical protein